MEMTPEEMRRLIQDLGWTIADLVRFTGRDRVRTYKQARGKEPIDPAMAFWLRGYHYFTLNPPPRPPAAPHESERPTCATPAGFGETECET
jgi:hypothetical protein